MKNITKELCEDIIDLVMSPNNKDVLGDYLGVHFDENGLTVEFDVDSVFKTACDDNDTDVPALESLLNTIELLYLKQSGLKKFKIPDDVPFKSLMENVDEVETIYFENGGIEYALHLYLHGINDIITETYNDGSNDKAEVLYGFIKDTVNKCRNDLIYIITCCINSDMYVCNIVKDSHYSELYFKVSEFGEKYVDEGKFNSFKENILDGLIKRNIVTSGNCNFKAYADNQEVERLYKIASDLDYYLTTKILEKIDIVKIKHAVDIGIITFEDAMKSVEETIDSVIKVCEL